jgi:molecular chaperone HtpG
MEVQVGKYTLESLTTGMYSDPKIVFREYIQNCVDALENAVHMGIIEKQSMRIDIIVNEEESLISLRDNGTGIHSSEAKSMLMNVGNSKKRNSNNRGFRGIGRLGGMSYCDTLVFTTSAEGEKCKTVITYDCKKLRKLLVPGEYEDLTLSAVLGEITTIELLPEKREKHYFLVEMKEVSGSSDLLDIEAARSYICQVAPLSYQGRHFIYISQLKEYLHDHGYEVEEFPVFVGENESDLEPVYKPNKSRFRSDRNKKTVDEIYSMSYFDITIDGELYALGWYGNCNWNGFLSERKISGFRLRKGNILIGDSKTLNGVFKEARFNGWTQGEIFITTDKLVPNARRDDFEQNEAYYQLIEALSNGVALDITRAIREASRTRNDPSAKALKDVDKKVSEATAFVVEGFNSSIDKERIVKELTETANKLEKIKVKDEFESKKNILKEKVDEVIEQVSESSNYKINKINSGIDKKSKHMLKTVSDILSKKLSKFLVDEIIDEIITELNGK